MKCAKLLIRCDTYFNTRLYSLSDILLSLVIYNLFNILVGPKVVKRQYLYYNVVKATIPKSPSSVFS